MRFKLNILFRPKPFEIINTRQTFFKLADCGCIWEVCRDKQAKQFLLTS
jgi:hypothetical protein